LATFRQIQEVRTVNINVFRFRRSRPSVAHGANFCYKITVLFSLALCCDVMCYVVEVTLPYVALCSYLFALIDVTIMEKDDFKQSVMNL